MSLIFNSFHDLSDAFHAFFAAPFFTPNPPDGP